MSVQSRERHLRLPGNNIWYGGDADGIPAKPPPSIEVLPDNLPQELKLRPAAQPEVSIPARQNKKEPWTRPPYQPNGKPASVIDPKTWGIFDFVLTAYIKAAGSTGLGVPHSR